MAIVRCVIDSQLHMLPADKKADLSPPSLPVSTKADSQSTNRQLSIWQLLNVDSNGFHYQCGWLLCATVDVPVHS